MNSSALISEIDTQNDLEDSINSYDLYNLTCFSFTTIPEVNEDLFLTESTQAAQYLIKRYN